MKRARLVASVALVIGLVGVEPAPVTATQLTADGSLSIRSACPLLSAIDHNDTAGAVVGMLGVLGAGRFIAAAYSAIQVIGHVFCSNPSIEKPAMRIRVELQKKVNSIKSGQTRAPTPTTQYSAAPTSTPAQTPTTQYQVPAPAPLPEIGPPFVSFSGYDVMTVYWLQSSVPQPGELTGVEIAWTSNLLDWVWQPYNMELEWYLSGYQEDEYTYPLNFCNYNYYSGGEVVVAVRTLSGPWLYSLISSPPYSCSGPEPGAKRRRDEPSLGSSKAPARPERARSLPT